jgi:signal transduction histidine kinase
MNKAHDIFLLMLNLTQFKTTQKIIEFFLAAMGNMWEELNFRFKQELEKNEENVEDVEEDVEWIELTARIRSFGIIGIQGSPVDQTELALIRNAVRMLSIILENKEQERLLSDEKMHLEEAVKRRTEELEAANQQLKQKIEEQKRLESQLLQAQKMEAIGTMAGGIAHDFNNILGAIVGYAELSTFKVDDGSKVYGYLQQILVAAERGKNTVSQILTFSRKNEPEKKPVHLEPIIDETLDLLKSSLPSTIKITKHLEHTTAAVIANPNQIQQVLMNLCSNAAHAMSGSEKQPVLEIELKEISLSPEQLVSFNGLKKGRYFKLSISDTGHGIDHAIQDRIFEPFFTTKGNNSHSGMGLAVVHGIVNSHGGEIKLESVPGEGAAFHVFLPAVKAAVQDEPDTIEIIPAERRGEETILFVDDEIALVDVGEQMLRQIGYRVVSTTSSVKALEIFKQSPHKFHLIVTDHTMPNMSGVQLAKEARNIRPDIPIILCTGYTEYMDAEKAQEEGLQALLWKPYSRAEMSHTIRKVLD